MEIGGYNPRFFRQNPPPESLEEWARKEAMFNLLLAKSLPRVRILSAEARLVQKKAGILDKEKDLFELSCVVTNEGFLPTALKMAERVKFLRPDWVEVKLPEGAALESGFKARVEIGHLKSGEKKEVRWRFKIKPAAQGSGADAKAAPVAATKATPLEAEASVSSTCGGVNKKKVQFTP